MTLELEARDFESTRVQHGKVRELSKVGLRGTLIGNGFPRPRYGARFGGSARIYPASETPGYFGDLSGPR